MGLGLGLGFAYRRLRRPRRRWRLRRARLRARCGPGSPHLALHLVLAALPRRRVAGSVAARLPQVGIDREQAAGRRALDLG